MNVGIKELFYPFRWILIIGLVVLFILMSYMILRHGIYNQNLFEIKLNDMLVVGNYKENISSNLFVHFNDEGDNYTDKSINKVILSDQMILQIDEYEVYNKAGRRVSADDYWVKLDDYIYEKVDYSKIELEIKRTDKILYSGDYIADISNYLNENGRYYIHIYVNRKDGWFSGVKTHFSFNVIVGDEYEK